VRKPDLVCIGAQKAGTSWFHEVFGSRSDVWVPPFKELHFFDHKFIPANRRWTKWHVAKGVKSAKARYHSNPEAYDPDFLEYLRMIETPPMFNGRWYRSIFAKSGAQQICMDVTPEYCTIPDEGVEFVKRFLPHSQFLFIVRDPLERVISQLRMNLSRKKLTPSSHCEWIEAVSDPELLVRGDYIQYIPRWRQHFSDKRLLIMPFAKIKTSPYEFLSEVERFVGLPKSIYLEDPSKQIHKTSRIKIPEFAIDYLREKIQPQHDFLAECLGREYLRG